MSVKSSVLAIFEQNRGESISGEYIAKALGISRNSVWKTVKVLREEGYKIDASTKNGYILSVDNDIISVQSVLKYLNFPLDIVVLDKVNSTNNYAKRLATEGKREGTVVIARHQSDGKGRKGRNFYSPDQTGIYMSIILRPTLSAEKSVVITTCAAASVAKAIEKISGKETKIKWVNDIFLNDKKVSGILTEAALQIETSRLQYVILGIGVNVLEPSSGFPQEISEIAGAVFNEETAVSDVKSKLAAEILNNFFEIYKNILSPDILEEYKKRSLITGKEILVVKEEEAIEATALEITDNYGLKVKYSDGRLEELISGEVSIRKI